MIYIFKDCEIDTARLELRREGKVQPIEPQVLSLLIYLIEHRRRVVARGELFDTIWQGRVVADAALYGAIKSARAAIGDQGPAQAVIRTVSRRGYQFVAEVGEGGEAVVSENRAPSFVSTVRLRFWVGGATTIAALVLALVLWSHVPVSASLHPALQVPSIAVLPFVNMGSGEDAERFADGLTEELTDQLSQISGVRVAGRTSAFRFKGRNEDLRTIAKALAVSSILEGSVRRNGDRLRITAQLIDSNGKHIWSRTYEGDRSDTFSIQNDVAKSVAAAFSVAVNADSSAAGQGGTTDQEAHDAYLSARAAMIDPGLASAEDVRYALRQLEHAVALDPNFALAWTWLSMTYMKSDALPEKGTLEFKTRARQAASRARQLAPDSPWVLAAEALVAMQDLRWGEADQLLARARARASATEDPWTCSGCLYILVGEPREALKHFRRARLVEPASVSAVAMSVAHMTAGDLEEAQQELQKELQQSTGARFMVLRQGVTEALVERDRSQLMEALSRIPEPDLSRQLGKFLDDREAALAELRRLGTILPGQYGIGSNVGLGLWAAYFEDYELALTFLEAASEDSCNTFALWNPLFKESRQLPRFKALVRKLKLDEYWRGTGKWNEFCRPIGETDFQCS